MILAHVLGPVATQLTKIVLEKFFPKKPTQDHTENDELSKAEKKYWKAKEKHDFELLKIQRSELDIHEANKLVELARAEREECALELQRAHLEWLREKNTTDINLALERIQADFDKERWVGILSRRETSDILESGRQKHRLLMIVSEPDMSPDCPSSMINNLPKQLRSDLKEFLEKYYPQDNDLCPVEFYGKFFKTAVFDTEVKQLEMLLSAVPTVVIYSDLTDEKLSLHLRGWGLPMQPLSRTISWNWEIAKKQLDETSGNDEKQSLKQIRQLIVNIHQLLAAFLADVYYLGINPLYEPRLLQLPQIVETKELLPYFDVLCQLQKQRRTDYESLLAEHFDPAHQMWKHLSVNQDELRLLRLLEKQRIPEERKTLVRIILHLKVILRQLGDTVWTDYLNVLEAKIRSDQFKIMVVGGFKTGKSTFINALIGQAILPAYSTPCTAIINEIKWAEEAEARAILYFRDPLPASLPEELSARIRAYLEAHQGKTPPPMTLSKEEIERGVLEELVVIFDPDKPQAQSVSETPLEKVEIYWPLGLCRNGVEIIDSPGLNLSVTRDKITVDYLDKVDAVLFVLSCPLLVTKWEMQFFEQSIKAAGHEHIFFVCNWYDLIREKERQQIRDFGNKKLIPLTKLKEKGVHFISAIQALEGRLKLDASLLEKSRLPLLERDLMEFLIRDRGKIKLLQPSREITRVLEEIRDQIIPSQRQALQRTSEQLENKVKEVKSKLREIHARDIQSIQEQMNVILQDKRAGEARVQEKMRILQEVENSVAEIDHELKQFLLKIAHE